MLLALVAIIMPIGARAYYEPEPEPVVITLAESIATFYYSGSSLVIPDGISASVITGVEVNEDGTVTVTEEDVEEIIPAGCAVILRGDIGVYAFFEVFEEGNVPESNLLLGSDEYAPFESINPEENYLFFTLDNTLSNTSNTAYFKDWIYVDNEVINEPHKAYLALPVGNCTGLAEMLGALYNPHLQHTHGGCEICGQVTVIEAAWGASADDLTSYGTLEDAITAAAEEGVGYIQLLENVENCIVVDGGTFTLDLNGHTISSESHTLDIQNESNVTIVDNSGTNEGKVITLGAGCFSVGVSAGASVTISDGIYESTYYSALDVSTNGSATINGGTFTSTDYDAIYNSGNLEIVKGTIKSENYNAIFTNGNLIIKGGTFTSTDNLATINYESGSINLSEYPLDNIMDISISSCKGSSFIPSAETILLPEGYCFFDSEGSPVTILENNSSYCIGKEPVTKYTITFVANGGGGEMADGISYGDYLLHECTFTAPEGMMFKAWQIDGEEYQPYETVTIEDNTTITALWTDYVPQIIIKMHDSAGDGWHGDSIVVKMNGEKIGTATMEDGDGYDNIMRYEYDNMAEYTFYWQHAEHESRYPDECSFEIFIEDEEVFAADNDKCYDFVDGELIYTIEVKVAELESLTINDGELTEYNNTVPSTTVGTLTYTRTLPNLMWNALYVPFEIPLSELADNYDVAYINDIRSYDNDENGEIDDMTMEIIRINSGTLNANHPYLIRAKNEEAQNMEIVLSDATLYRTEEISLNCSSMYMEFTITGTYNTLSYENLEEKYAISTSGAWQKLSVGSSLKPFRLYMEMTPRDGSPVKVEAAALSRIRINMQGEGGNTTGVEILEAPQSINDAVLYDLYGRKVTTPVKGGIYISNGKKVIVN